ncbi:MAG TPA: hypothetical protein VH062_07485 [Polyangiaceae bacterium]|jgi:hypothetical protein|nr:hypothetical protein [Polyangiaceae bacterium]
MIRSLLVCSLALFVPGCLLGGVRVEQIATSTQKPANVAVYVSVSKGDAPATGLTEKDFHILEDGTELSPEQTTQALLPRDEAAVHRALLLVDMSGPVTEGDTRHQIALATAQFVTRAHLNEPVTVYAFDGGASIRFIADFQQGTDEIGALPQLESYSQTDSSSNLNSAIIESLTQLDARMMTTQKPLRIGSLIVFARGPDLAGRVADSKMIEAIDESKDLLFAISIKDVPGFRANRVGRTGAFEAESPVSLLHAFDEAGMTVGNLVTGYYLLSYCSPARAGKRNVRVRVVTTDAEGKEMSGSTSTEIDASGFTAGCDATQKPRFVVPSPHVDAKPESGSDDAKPAEPASATKEKPSKPGTKGAPAAGDDEGDAVVPPPAKPGYAQ